MVTRATETLGKSTGRLEAFSDGVFAIAITLLVLELKVPHLASGAIEPNAQALASSLISQWPAYFSFVTSFLTILIMWMHHHNLFQMVHRTDAALLFANGLLLLMVSAVPFPTAVLAEYFGTSASWVATEFYCGTFFVIALCFYGVLYAALRPQIRDPDVPPETLRRWRRSYKMGPPGYGLAALCAPFDQWLALLICTALWILWAVLTRNECSLPTGLESGSSALDTRA